MIIDPIKGEAREAAAVYTKIILKDLHRKIEYNRKWSSQDLNSECNQIYLVKSLCEIYNINFGFLCEKAIRK